MHEYSDYKLLSKLQQLIGRLPYSRRLLLQNLAKCNTYPLYAAAGTKQDVLIEMREDSAGHRDAYYVGLGMCENVWACPRCAPLKIREYRDRISAIINHWRARGYVAAMVTFTIPHYIYQTADEVFTNLRNTYRKFQLNVITHWRREHCLGTIDTTECKYNSHHGWHFHKHILFFIPEDEFQTFTSTDFENNWRAKWQKLCTPLLHREPNWKVNCGLVISKHIVPDGSYVAKEMAKLRSNKHSAKWSRTPFELLESNDPRDNDLYIEYCEAIYRRSRIHIGRGLSKGVDFDAKKNSTNDTQIISTAVVATFTFTDWQFIIRDEKDTGTPHRANILQAALEDYFNGVFFYCHQHALPFPHEPDEYARRISIG